MHLLGYMLAAICVGAMISTQPPLNAILARAIGSSLGATGISIFVAFLCISAVLLVTGAGEVSRAFSVPWWVYLAGVVGAIFVGAGVVIAPVTGALVFFVCVIAGQLIGSTIADHLGAFGLAVREATPTRILGILLVLGGAIMVSRG